ncbi:hypothetical protein J3E69DRAFT_331627 [Trichoderma sp. SZMC 28015]
MVGLRVLSERCYPMLIMYNGEISLRGISLRKPEPDQGRKRTGARRWRTLDRAATGVERAWFLSESWLGGFFW